MLAPPSPALGRTASPRRQPVRVPTNSLSSSVSPCTSPPNITGTPAFGRQLAHLGPQRVGIARAQQGWHRRFPSFGGSGRVSVT